jgi:F420-non-reducing hydrogenase large subunit
MSRKISIDPVTRLEGHGRIDIFLSDSGEVEKAYFVVPELRGFEVFSQGRPAEDMAQITPRICGVCPTAHHMVAGKTLDDLWQVEPPLAARHIRELLHNVFMLEDHALHFFVLAGPDFVVGPREPAAERNVLGVAKAVGNDVALRIIAMRKRLRWILQHLAGRAIHPVCCVPGGVAKPLPTADLDVLREIGQEALDFAVFTYDFFEKEILSKPQYLELISSTAYHHRTYYAGLVDENNHVNFYDGLIRVVTPQGKEFAKFDVHEYDQHIAEHVEPWTYVRFAFLKQVGWKGFWDGDDSGIMAVAPLGRLNAAEGMATPRANKAYQRLFDLLGGKPCHYTLATHWARVIEMLYAAERIVELLEQPEITDRTVRSLPTATPHEGVGVVEAPRGLLVHHYQTDAAGLITGANLLVATQHNAARIALSVDKAAKAMIRGPEVDDGTLNLIEMAFRAYDPCMACATHNLSNRPRVLLRYHSAKDGRVLFERQG